jgi:hypothetical protein
MSMMAVDVVPLPDLASLDFLHGCCCSCPGSASDCAVMDNNNNNDSMSSSNVVGIFINVFMILMLLFILVGAVFSTSLFH